MGIPCAHNLNDTKHSWRSCPHLIRPYVIPQTYAFSLSFVCTESPFAYCMILPVICYAHTFCARTSRHHDIMQMWLSMHKLCCNEKMPKHDDPVGTMNVCMCACVCLKSGLSCAENEKNLSRVLQVSASERRLIGVPLPGPGLEQAYECMCTSMQSCWLSPAAHLSRRQRSESCSLCFSCKYS